ncbi:hypothetical protein IW261DRAFT_1612376 [Armillaria novae-zelandiae]|uniref:Heterokaryon incompatibility domain-containing protein n=1 Tax=Armillaria novae-zelandiae TaxID=153914 RepID=A0AA39NS98_9AGAR|nr:hypothetical protein IW261DRAFT_1612376 [Armillaria novae-zelandiae]
MIYLFVWIPCALAARKHRTLPLVTISALSETGQTESSIKVPKQRTYTDRRPVIPSSDASISCASLGTTKLLDRLNTTLGTSYILDTPSLSPHLESCILNDYDFGTAYARLHPRWYGDLMTIQDELCTLEAQDREMRERAFVDKRILTPLMPPRRVWDLYSNRVVPRWTIRRDPWAILHAWMDVTNRINVQTPINRYEWPVPIPKDTSLELIWIEMLNLGTEEDLRTDEWKLDMPTIGHVCHQNQMVVYYYSGLGRPLRLKPGDLDSRRCWFNWAWTLQEISENSIIGGDTDDGPLKAVPIDKEEDEVVLRFYKQLLSLTNIAQEVHNVFNTLAHMRHRASEGAIDKIAGMAFLLRSRTIPAYYETQSVEDAWAELVNAMRERYRGDMLFLYPAPGNGNRMWRPSWDQIQNMELPSTGGIYLYEEVMRLEEMDTDWHNGFCIEKAYVRGLAVEDSEGASGRAEMCVEDDTGRTHTFSIVATHQYPIPEDSLGLFLAWLRVLLSNLPTDLHAPKKGEFTRYPFATFCIDQAILECPEDEVGAINESFKAIFGWRTCTTGNGILDIKEHGKHGIGAVADLLEGYLKKYKDEKGSPNAVLVKWVEDISAGCVKIYHTHNKPIYLLKVGNTLDVLELDPDINLNAPCLRNVLPTSASEASAAVVFAALVESLTAPRPASNVDGAEDDVNEIDWDMI